MNCGLWPDQQVFAVPGCRIVACPREIEGEFVMPRVIATTLHYKQCLVTLCEATVLSPVGMKVGLNFSFVSLHGTPLTTPFPNTRGKRLRRSYSPLPVFLVCFILYFKRISISCCTAFLKHCFHIWTVKHFLFNLINLLNPFFILFYGCVSFYSLDRFMLGTCLSY